jgi:hypothetical protein
MANETQKYPFFAPVNWWRIRKAFKRTLPKEVSPSYFATVGEMTEDSAKKNIIPKLKTLGLITDDLKTTDLAFRWRDDESYSEVCKEIIDRVYPSELVDAILE